MQEKSQLGALDESPSAGAGRKPVLAGYSIADATVEAIEEDGVSTDKIRNLMVGGPVGKARVGADAGSHGAH